jgi:hypothetical protein
LTGVGFPCSTSTQCISNAYCSSGICTCLSSYYFNTVTGACSALSIFGQGCASSVQCPTNMVCTLFQCVCTATTYYVSPNCVSLISHGGACSITTLCDSTLGLVCSSSVCTCNTTQYWSTLANGTQVCANLRTLGQSCTTYTDCQNSATSVKCITNLCECDSSGYYLDQPTVTCLPLKSTGTICTATYNFQCASFNCNASSICGNTIASTIISNVTQVSSEASFRQSDMIVYGLMFIFIGILL